MKTATLICFLFIILSFDAQPFAKPQCKQYLDKLENIKSQQRQANTLKKSNRLRVQEEKFRKKWWQCEHNMLPKQPNSSKKNSNKIPAKKSKKSKKSPKKSKAVAITDANAAKRLKPITYNMPTIKGPFSGETQQEWLEYYQMPKKCFRPKTTQVFAYCAENKQEQQDKFRETLINSNSVVIAK